MFRKEYTVSIDLQQQEEARRYILENLGEAPDIAIILGSGLGNFTGMMDNVRILKTREIPHYPASTVVGHQGEWVTGTVDGVSVLAVRGRVHAYEGYSHGQVAFPVHVLASLGVKKLIVTNAAGGINRFYRPGDFMVIVDHINLTFDNPLFGPNPRQIGPRFPDMISAYDPEWVELALEEGRKLGVPIHKGVYLGVKGPSYETAAEIRMAERIGADAVGMSTVPEVIAAAFRGLRVLGISFISNMATGISQEKLDHEEVTRMAEQVQDRFTSLIRRILKRM